MDTINNYKAVVAEIITEIAAMTPSEETSET